MNCECGHNHTWHRLQCGNVERKGVECHACDCNYYRPNGGLDMRIKVPGPTKEEIDDAGRARETA
jgi:hypothetical protein